MVLSTDTFPINTPEFWRDYFPWPKAENNKYDRGHAVISGGEWHSTGATKLAAHAALRIGSGLVSVACDARSLSLYAASFQAVMTKLTETTADFIKLISDPRVTAILIGPAAGTTEHTKTSVIEALATRKALVLDADALSVFSEMPETLFACAHASCILTPHDGEFVHLFGVHVNRQDSRTSRALQAARLSGAVIILKGSDTIIAAPDGRIIVNANAPAFLATAGSGDVLAGICVGLLAQGMPPFEAACTSVWLHSEAARRFGAGLIAEDIAKQLPHILQQLCDVQP